MKCLIQRLKTKRIYMTFFLSLLLIFSIPSLVFSMLYQGYFAERYERKVEDSNIEVFERIKQQMDSNIVQFQKIATVIAGEYRFSADYINSHTTAWLFMMQQLSEYKNLNNSIHDILYLHRDIQLVYSAFGACNPRYLPVARAEPSEGQTVQQNFFISGANSVAAAQTSRQVVEYAVPVDRGRGMVIFQLYGDELWPGADLGDGVSAVLLDEAGQVIYKPGYDPKDLSALELTIQKIPDRGMVTGIGNKRKIFVYRAYLDHAGVSLLFSMPYGDLAVEMESMNQIFLGFALFLALFCTLLIVFLTNRNYHPIKTMRGYLSQMAPDIPAGLSETEAASYAVQSLAQKGRKLEREKLLRRLLRQTIPDFPQLKGACRSAGMDMGSRMVAVFLITLTRADHAGAGTALLAEAARMAGELTDVYDTEYVENSSQIYVCILPDSGYEAFLADIQTVSGSLLEKYGAIFRIAVGEPGEGFEGVYRSFAAARALSRKKLSPDQALMRAPAAPVRNSEEFIYPKVELDGLLNAIVNRNGERTEFLLNVLLDAARSDFSDAEGTAVCLYYDIINSMRRAVYELKQLDEEQWANMPGLCAEAITGVEELDEYARRFGCEILSRISQSGSLGDSLYRQILSYIADNLEDPELCVNRISDSFGVGASGVSHLFKSRTGVNLSDYIAAKRLERIKVLLLSTDLPVGEIARRMGYSQTSSFIRRFKSMQGMTPGEYRQMAKAAE